MYEYLSLNVAAMSLAVFLLFKNHTSNITKRFHRVIVKSGEKTFGIYLVHVFWLDLFVYKIFIKLGYKYGWLLVPVMALVVYLLSYATTEIIKRIPVLGKRIV